ncbi:ISKra4 family transposase [Microcoleus sp. N9_B4]|uniref:ISKra4 family transposase n=1 Tax=Microcoleus sp. N9_B4 TaxID=3055386 RepID=UPI002FD09187
MTPSDQEQLKAYLKAAAEILYRNTDPTELESFDSIEKSLRQKMLEEVGPELGSFFFPAASGIQTGKSRKIKSIVGSLEITDNQAKYFGLKAYSQFSPLMEKCCLLISANESYQMAEKDLEIFTGIKISHSTLHRLVKRQEFELPISKQGVQEITLDGGKVRLRNESKGEGCYWKDYKAVCFDNVYSGAFFQNNQDLIDWTNSQKLLHPMYCLGDGHAGIWKIFQEIGDVEQRQEILDWYHLKENLYKIGGSLKRLKLAENMLWQGKIDEVINLFKEMKKKEVKTFCNYLETHRCRIVNYQYYKEESISSIGSGTVESIIKRIGFRVKISGAQWNIESVPSILSLRCAYLNGQLSI